MAATDKLQLLEITDKEFNKLAVLIDSLSAAQAIKKHDDNTSIKDVIGHRAHWITLFLGWYTDGMAGKTVYFPAEGYKWNELKKYNAALRSEQAKLKWPEAVSLLQSNHHKLVKFIKSRSNKVLYQGPMKGANNNWTPGRWAEAAGASHYRSAAKFIRQCARADLRANSVGQSY